MTQQRPSKVATEPSALRISEKCPACGAAGVVVFPVYFAENGEKIEEPRYICVKCSPKEPPQ